MNPKIKVGSLITAKMLVELDACNEDVEFFKLLWPDGVTFRLKNLIRAADEGLDISWFAESILSNQQGRWSEMGRFNNLYFQFDEGDIKMNAALALWEVVKKR